MSDRFGMTGNYLVHSAKGTSWEKKDHKWVKKVQGAGGKIRYIYDYNITGEGYYDDMQKELRDAQKELSEARDLVRKNPNSEEAYEHYYKVLDKTEAARRHAIDTYDNRPKSVKDKIEKIIKDIDYKLTIDIPTDVEYAVKDGTNNIRAKTADTLDKMSKTIRPKDKK